MPIQITLATCPDDLRQILALQAANHKAHLSAAEMADQGFLTISHAPDVLEAMHAVAPSVVAKDGAAVVGYALMMVPSMRARIPALEPLFVRLNTLTWRGAPVPKWRYFVMGQVCVAKAYRGQGVFDGLYAHLRESYKQDYQLAVTEVSARNGRSLRAHERAGWFTLDEYVHASGEGWRVVGWALGE